MAVSLSRRTGAVAFLAWIWDGLDRTIFTAIKFSFPARFVSPFGFLGMLTFITFVILGISGALLMFYYEPILDRAWDSVEFINNDVPFGCNIHYHGSNAMVLLAILHMYYQYFSGRYKIRNEILWRYWRNCTSWRRYPQITIRILLKVKLWKCIRRCCLQ